ncbi:MAG: AAA family ATPase [Chitinivibrionales bacterium]|nr:AAA family ATPase [Chitinivibrionales bacterium]
MVILVYYGYMKRFAENFFNTWLKSKSRKPLIVRGARQVGKSTFVRQVAQADTITLHEINLERHPELQLIFKTMDPVRILREIELVLNKGPIHDRHTLLFLDEIQAVPEAIAALRYFYEERPHLAVIAAGSLLEFTLSDHRFSMPVGRLEYYHLGPMSFGEFLVAGGRQQLQNYLSAYRTPQDASAAAHESLMALVRDYLFTGGMPEAVKSFFLDHDPRSVREIHLSILNTCRDDFAKYADKNQLQRLRRVFDYVPVSIGKKFTFAQVNRDWQAKEIRSAADMLAQAGLISRVHHVSGAGVPLGTGLQDTVFKPLFLDVGLMNTASGAAPLTLEQFQSERFMHEGPLAEQFVGQHLLYAAGAQARPELFYWLREGRSANAEVDYVIQAGSHVVPVEVKAGATGSLRSLHQFVAAYNTPLAVRFDMNPPSMQSVKHTVVTPKGNKDISFVLMSLPLYMVEQCPGLARSFFEN